MLEELLIPDLRLAIAERDWQSLAEFCNILHPSLVAQEVSRLPEREDVFEAFSQVDHQFRPTVFEYLSEDVQDWLVRRLPKQELAKLIERMAHDDRANLVRRMEPEQQAVIMPLVARAEREDILRLQRYDEGTAGSIMTTDYAWLPANITVMEAIARLRREAPDRETIYYVYVVDHDRHLIGIVSLRSLILAAPDKTLGDVMWKDVLKITAETDVESVAAALAKYDLLAVPVVDASERLVGIITHDDVIDVVIEEATEDAHRMGAVQPLDFAYVQTPVWQILSKRLPWLAALFGAEMFAVLALRANGGLINDFKVIIFFMPVIIATGGNSGSQAATLITRALALAQIEPRDWKRVVIRELLFGLALGGAVGLLGIVAVVAFHEPIVHALALWISLIVVTTTGSLVGAVMPLIFKHIGWDPAISSGPFVASVVDVLGVVVYCKIAATILTNGHPLP